jgi:hypothetical protein
MNSEKSPFIHSNSFFKIERSIGSAGVLDLICKISVLLKELCFQFLHQVVIAHTVQVGHAFPNQME